MNERLRVPLFVIALICLVLALALDLGGLLFIRTDQGQPPGLAITYMALIDGILLFTVLLMALELVISQNLLGRLQGCMTLIFGIVIVIAGIPMILFAIAKLLLMVGLVLAVPFGTAIYLALFGSFPRGAAAALLGTIMLLKVLFAIFLVLSEPRYLESKGLIFTVLLSLGANVLVSFLLGFPPGILVSITDALAAIIVAIVGVIVAVVLLVFAIAAVLRAIQVNRGLQAS
jgi:hypothetical protein